MTGPNDIVGEIAALRRELTLTWEAHAREHEQHERAHSREHEFAQKAIETAATLAKENKADANEWRATMTDRESRFATKEDVKAILARLDGIERANILSDERDRTRLSDDAEGQAAGGTPSGPVAMDGRHHRRPARHVRGDPREPRHQADDLVSGTVADLLRDMRAEHAARITYDRAVERHFIQAERLARTDPQASDRIARGAAALRMDARYELVVR